jgi:hypothetical protein
MNVLCLPRLTLRIHEESHHNRSPRPRSLCGLQALRTSTDRARQPHSPNKTKLKNVIYEEEESMTRENVVQLLGLIVFAATVAVLVAAITYELGS